MCSSKAEGGVRCAGIPKEITNARRRLKRTHSSLQEAKAQGDSERVKALTERFNYQALEALEAEHTHPETFQNPYRHLSAEEAAEVIESRTQDPELDSLIAKRDVARQQLEEAKEAKHQAKEAYDADPTDENHEALRQSRFDSYEAYAEYLAHKESLEEYKDVTALAAARLAELTTFEEEFEGNELGNTIKTATYDSGTREWLEQRQGGIGGSDVGDILKVDEDYADTNYREVFLSKTTDISDEEVALQADNNSNFSGAQGRGNAWEPLIAQRFAEENPEYTLIHSKSSWVNKDEPWQYANVDGILSDREDREPNGILEIKTASDAADWENGVPAGYRAQVLHYLDATGFKYAHVAVLIDDKEYRSYRIEHDERIDPRYVNSPTYAEAKPALKEFWQEAQEKAKHGKEFTPPPYGYKSKWSWSGEKRKQTTTRDIAAFRQEDPETVRARVESLIKQGHDPDDVIRNEFTSFDPASRTKDTVSIDLETSGYTAETGEILEIGIVRRNPKGEVVDSHQELFSIDSRVLAVKGTGAQDVHHISVDDIEGKRSFRDPAVQSRIQEIMGTQTGDTVMLAHNARFEQKWLNQYLDGFHKANIPTVCTMQLSRYLVGDTANNKLATFAPRFGVPYRNAHRALVDAEMTDTAYENFLSEVAGKENKF